MSLEELCGSRSLGYPRPPKQITPQICLDLDWLATAMEFSYVPLYDESRHSQIQMMAAMMSATQLTPIGIW